MNTRSQCNHGHPAVCCWATVERYAKSTDHPLRWSSKQNRYYCCMICTIFRSSFTVMGVMKGVPYFAALGAHFYRRISSVHVPAEPLCCCDARGRSKTQCISSLAAFCGSTDVLYRGVGVLLALPGREVQRAPVSATICCPVWFVVIVGVLKAFRCSLKGKGRGFFGEWGAASGRGLCVSQGDISQWK